MRPVRLLVCLSLLLAAGASTVAADPAAARISLKPRFGPPTSKVNVARTGFGASETVDVSFDTTPVTTAPTDPAGAFSARFKVPTTAVPGSHTVTATGETSGLTASAVFLVRTDWAKFHFDLTNSGFNPYENVLGQGNVGSMVKLWSFAAGNPFYSPPTIVGGVAYAGSSDGNVYALNASTGVVLWSVNPNPSGYYVRTSPAVTNGVVFTGSTAGIVDALKASTGAKVWSFATGGAVNTSPAVASGLVFVGSDDDSIYALNASTGAKVWSFTAGNVVLSSPAVANGAVYVGSNDDKVYALNASTGAKLWSFTTGSAVSASPAVANGVVYVGSADDSVYALNASTGAKVWSFTTGSVVGSAAVANGVVYVSSFDNDEYALNASTGAKLWSLFNIGCTFPVVANGMVYFGSGDHSLYAYGLP